MIKNPICIAIQYYKIRQGAGIEIYYLPPWLKYFENNLQTQILDFDMFWGGNFGLTDKHIQTNRAFYWLVF